MSDDPTSPPEYPELAKMGEMRQESQAIGEFLEWAQSKGLMLGEHVQYEDRYQATFVPISKSTEELLAEHFEIDLDKVEAERREILGALRRVSG